MEEIKALLEKVCALAYRVCTYELAIMVLPVCDLPQPFREGCSPRKE